MWRECNQGSQMQAAGVGSKGQGKNVTVEKGLRQIRGGF